MPTTLHRLTAANSLLVVVDVQDKLLVKIPAKEKLVRNIAFLLDAAKLVNVPALATEQYPKGLGPTTAELARRLPHDLPAKTAFSCCGAAGFLAELRTHKRPAVVVTGMETHVCVMQTALDLRDAGFQVFLPVDSVASRFQIDHDTALHRLAAAGCILTTCEAVGFEWLGDSHHPQFKAFSQLVIERSQS